MNEKLTIERDPDRFAHAAFLRLTGALDGHGGRRLMQLCGPLRAEGKSVVLVLDEVNFISSSGIGVLLALTEDFRDRGLTLRVARPSKEVRMAIGLLNLEHYLDIHDTEDSAVRDFAA